MASKKSKILAMALCASVMTGIYASPVMADGQISGMNVTGVLGAGLAAQDKVVINGVELEILPDGTNGKVTAAGGNFTQLTVTSGMEITGSMEITGGTLTVGGTSIDSTNGNTVVGGTLTATKLASLNGGLEVSGDATVNGKLTAADGLTVNNGGIKVENEGGLTIEGGLAELNGGLSVTGGATVDSLTSTGKATVGGALEVTGETTLKNTTVNGTLTAGSGNFTVDTYGNTTIIGADKQLTVEGTAQIGTMAAATAQVGGDLTVVGETTLARLTAKGAADLQDGLTVSKGATVNGGLTVDTDRFVVDGVTGNTTVGGTLTAGATDVESLDVTNNATVGGTLTAGATTVDSLTVKGAATVDSLEVAKGIEAAKGKFELTEEGVLTVNGKAYFTEGATIQKGLSVTGGASVDGNFAVTNGGLSVSGGESVLNGGLTVSGYTKLDGNLNVGAGNFEVDKDGNTEFNGNLNIKHGNFTVDAATGDTVVKGNLNLGSLEGREVGEVIKGLEEYTGKLQDADLPGKVEGIDRDPVDGSVPNGEGVTTIEGMAKFDSEGMTIGNTVVTDGAITTNTINAGGTIINNVGMTVGDTAVADSKITVGAADDQTIIEGGAITAKSLVLGTKDVGATIAGIERETITDEFGNEVSTTTIEGALKVSDNGLISNAAGSFTVDSNGGLAAGGGTFAADMTGIKMNAPVQMILQGDYNYQGKSVIDLGTTISDIDDRLVVLEDKTQNIKPGTGAGTGTGEGGTAAGESNNIIEVPATGDGHTGINGNVTVGGDINAGTGNIGGIDMAGGTITTGNTTIDGEGIDTGSGEFTGNVTVGGDINASTGNIGGIDMAGGTINTGDTTITGTGINTGNGNFTGNVDVDVKVTVGDGTTITGEGITTGTGTFDDVIIGENTTINGNGIDTVNGNFTGNVDVDGKVTVGDNTTITDGNINLGRDNGTNINADGMTVGTGENATSITNDTVKAQNGDFDNLTAGSGTFGTGNNKTVINNDGVTVGGENGSSITGEGITVGDKNGVSIKNDEVRVGGGEDGKGGSYMNDTDVVTGEGVSLNQTAERVGHLENRVGKLEDRIDKVGAMSAAIANLRTMGYDPAAPTEVAVGIGQYRDETGAALGLFHYPNRDFMLSLSVSTSGDEVMGGIGATWKFGRKSPEKVAEIKKAQAEADARRAEEAKLAKAEEMKQAAKEAKVKAQQERHAKMAAEMKK